MVKNAHGDKYIVLRGLNHRVKFTVSDNIKWIEYYRGNELENRKMDTHKRKIQFTVEVLENRYNPNTSYSSGGNIEYYGDDFWEAWSTVQSYVFNANLPKEFEKYATGEEDIK